LLWGSCCSIYCLLYCVLFVGFVLHNLLFSVQCFICGVPNPTNKTLCSKLKIEPHEPH
jgi:hypothetical protein